MTRNVSAVKTHRTIGGILAVGAGAGARPEARPVLARHGSNSHRKHSAGHQRDNAELREQVSVGGDRGRAFRFDIQREPQHSDGLLLAQRLFSTLSRADEIAAVLPRVAHRTEHLQLRRRVEHAGDDEGKHDGRCDEEQFLIEAHSAN